MANANLTLVTASSAPHYEAPKRMSRRRPSTAAATQLDLYRARKAAPEITTSLHIEINNKGEIITEPMKIAPNHCMGMLEILTAVMAQIIDVKQGKA